MNTQTLKTIKFLIAGGVLLSAYVYVDSKDNSIVINNQINANPSAHMGRNVEGSHKSKAPIPLARLPASLQGVDTNIQLSNDASGSLIVNQALRDMFEVYLSAHGEESLEAIILRIQNTLTDQLQNPALEQALTLLDSYIAYRQALVELEAYINEKSDLLSQVELFKVRQAKVKTLRDQYFDEAAYEGFFE
jgi:lipase chaperone LimK